MSGRRRSERRVDGHELGRALREAPVPLDPGAERRGLDLALTAYAAREPHPLGSPLRPLRPARPLPRLALALALAALLAALILSPAGAAVRDWVGDVVSTPAPPPPSQGLGKLPGGGRLLVQSAAGPWVVRADGSRRLLGDYREASWSPRGLYVAVASGGELTAVTPGGTPHWTLSAPAAVRDARWSPSGYLIAYRSGPALRVVAGDGSEDRLVAPSVAPLPATWNPLGLPQLAYVDSGGGLRIADVERGGQVTAGAALPHLRSLEWGPGGGAAAGGGELLEASGKALRLRPVGIEKLAARTTVGRGHELPLPEAATVRSAALAPYGRTVAAVLGNRRLGAARSGPAGPSSSVVVWDGGRGTARRLLTVPGQLTELAFSPDGSRLLVAWPEADEWLFLPLHRGRRASAVGEVSEAFSPGHRPTAFPRLAGWCCRSAG